MKFVLYTNALSAHQIPLAKEIAKRIGADNFRYIYTSKNGQKLQESNTSESWIHYVPEGDFQGWLGGADVVLSGLRCLDMFESRAKRGLKTFYMSERWFKPPIGMWRLLHPKYFNMARRLVKLMRSEPTFTYLPMGIHAARDMARLCGLFAGDLRCLFRAPKLDFEKKPGGRVFLSSSPLPATAKSPLQLPTTTTTKYCLDKMRIWGYFVAPSNYPAPQITHNTQLPTPNSIRVLWVGRMLKLKRVDTIIRAVGELSRLNASLPPTTTRPSNSNLQLSLDIYGTGPEENRLKKLAANYGDIINFHPPVPIDEVRNLMRQHDIYVLASNAYEGWGAVVSEALEEEMLVFGSKEAGSASTMLPAENLFDANDWRSLYALLLKALDSGVDRNRIGNWCASNAAAKLLSLIEAWRENGSSNAQ